MKHEVFILGGQRINQKSKKGWKEEKLGEMRKGRRERGLRKGAIVPSSPQKGRRERGLRKGAIVPSSPQGSGYDKLELKHKNLVFSSL